MCARSLRVGSLVASLLLLCACERAPERLSEPFAVPITERVDKAKGAAADLQKTLSTRLRSTIETQGAEAAIDVCAKEALAMTQAVGERQGLRIGRSSSRLRNPKNAPRPWVAEHLRALEGKAASEAKLAVYDLGEELGVAVPLITQPLCTTCHGPAEAIAAPLRAKLSARYPEDRAMGYSVGQLRGVIWIELAKR